MTKSKITSHILDVEKGKPASGVTVCLEAFDGSSWAIIAKGETNDDGRVVDWIKQEIREGKFRISFDIQSYFEAQKRECFYPSVSIEFYLKDMTEHYHVPLLLSGHGYSTYRGS